MKRIKYYSAALAACALSTTSGLAQTTHYDGANGAWNIDTWNTAANWDAGAGVVPSGAGPWEVIIDAGKKASLRDVVTPAYTGNLTLEAGAALEIGQTANATALNALGTGNVTFNTGTDLTLRYTVNSTHPQNFILNGDMVFALGRSTSAHHEQRTLTGSISGSGQMTVHDTNNQRLFLKGDNSSWSGGMVTGGSESESKNATIEADVTNSLGTGEITIGDGNTLRVDGADATTGTSSILGMIGRKSGKEGKKLYMNAADEVGQLKVDGYQQPNGTYGKVGSGAVHEMAWIDGNSLLTVSGAPADSTAPTVIIDATAAGNALPNVYVGEPVTYTITFNEPHTPALDASDLEITAGSTAATIVSCTPVAELGGMTVLSYQVVVTGDAAGTINLAVKSGTAINDLFGNALVVPVADDDTYNVNAWPALTDGVGFWVPWASGGINPVTGLAWAAGDTFVGAFVSSGTRDATSPDAADYNTFVQAAADAVGWNEATWYAVVSCYNDTENPDYNAARNANVPTMATSNVIVLPNGAKLADNGADLANGPDIFFNKTETGGEFNGSVGTGGGRMMGDPGGKIEHGSSTRADAAWYRVYNGSTSSQWHIYAMSEELTLTATGGGATYATWSGGAAAANIDSNNDGVTNGAAWALGAADKDANAIALLPTLDNTSDATYVIFNFNRSDDAEADPGTAITVQYGSDLAGWTDAVDDGDNVIITVTDGTPTDAVQLKLKRSTLGGVGKIFARLNVVVTP